MKKGDYTEKFIINQQNYFTCNTHFEKKKMTSIVKAISEPLFIR